MKREIPCYFGPQTAIIDERDFIHCKHCTWYTVTSDAKLYYLESPDKNQRLDDKEKTKLSDYVQKHYSPKKGKPVQITKKVIEEITGKESINIRYK